MGRTRNWLLLAAVLLVAASATETDARGRRQDRVGDIPPVLFTTLQKFDPSYPTFVSAEAAIDEKGLVDPTLFHPSTAKTIQSLFTEEWLLDGCYHYGEVYDDELLLPDRSTLPLAVKHSPVVLLGRVTERQYGFQGSIAGQLLEIEPEETLKGSAPLKRYFVFLPVGVFEAGPYRICKTDVRFPSPPARGDRLLLMVPRPLEDEREPFLDIATAEGVVVLQADGKADLPRAFEEQGKAAEVRRVGDVLAIARSVAGEEVR